MERIYVKRNKLMRNHFASCVLVNGYLYGFDTTGYGGTALFKCIDLRTAEERWSTRELGGKGCLLYADGHLLVLVEDGNLALVEATPDEFRMKAQTAVLQGPDSWASPALAGGRLYLRDHRQIVCLDL